jgi:CRP-like cAMP-binding protein
MLAMQRDDTRGPYKGGNAVLDRLSPELRAELEPHLTVFFEEEATVRISRDERIEMVYFPIDAVYSVIVDLSSGNAYEVDVIGRDGMVCSEIVLGAEIAPRAVLCQAPGHVARLTRDDFSLAAIENREFREAVRESARRQWFVSQQTVACNYAHTAEQRAARWVLMTHDAVGRNTFRLRTQFASMMLGLPERAVLEPIRVLTELECVRYEDEQVTIVSREALRKLACECYERQQIAPFISTYGLSPEL